MLQKLSSENDDLDHLFTEIMSLATIKEEVEDAGVLLFQYLYGDIEKTLGNHRLAKYNKMTTYKIVIPECLSPTDSTSCVHICSTMIGYCLIP